MPQNIVSVQPGDYRHVTKSLIPLKQIARALGRRAITAATGGKESHAAARFKRMIGFLRQPHAGIVRRLFDQRLGLGAAFAVEQTPGRGALAFDINIRGRVAQHAHRHFNAEAAAKFTTAAATLAQLLALDDHRIINLLLSPPARSGRRLGTSTRWRSRRLRGDARPSRRP